MDIAFWQEIIANDYQLPEDPSLTDMTVELLSYLGSIDPDERDTIAYNILARWIITLGYHTPDHMQVIIEWLVPKMADGLGEQGTDGIFQRSYSALVLSLIAYRDSQDYFLEAAEVRSLLDKARHYLIAEQDLRAYVPGKGWANACSHTADLLKFLARNGNLEAADLQRLINAVADKVLAETDTIYNHDEDERLAHTTMAVLKRDELTALELQDWLKRFTDWKFMEVDHSAFNPVYHATYQNIKNYLRSLYTLMQLETILPIEAQDIEPDLLETIRMYSI